jgi:hypothetical protein
MNKNFITTDAPKDKNNPTAKKENWETINQRSNAIAKCYDWFIKDRQAKMPYTNEMDEMYKLYKSDHWDLLDDGGRILRTDSQKENHPNAVENVTFSLIEGLVAEFSEAKELIDYPQEEGDDEIARTMTDLKEFIAYKNRLDAELIKWLHWFFLYGSGIWSKTWDPNWKGGKGPNRWQGEVRWLAKHPRSIFPDARCLDDAEDGRRIHDANYRTIEEVEETWPDSIGISPDSLSDDVVVSEELEESNVESTEDQVLVVDTWYKGSPMIMEGDEKDEGPGLHLIQWAGEGSLRYLSHANYCYFDPDEDCTFPIDIKKCYERERSPWGMGEAYQLKNPQIITNKTAELIVEGHVHEALGQTWYEEGAVTDKQQKVIEEKGTLGGMWFQVEDVNGIHREYSKGVPASLENEMNRLNKVMESIIGRYDISQGKTPGNVTAFRALDLLASRAQVRLKSKDMTINSSMEDSGNYINRLIARHYTDKRKYRILGKDDSKPKYGTYDGESVKKAYFYDTNESMPVSELETLTQGQETLPVGDQIIEGQDYEIYSPEFDTKCRITSKMPTDRVFYMEMAKELFSAQLIDAEDFYYVLEYGKFPPIEEILAKIKKQKEAARVQQPPAQQPMDPALEQQIQEFIQVLKEQRPDILKAIGQLPQEQQLPEIMKLMQEAVQPGQGSAPAPTPAPSEPATVVPDTGPGIPANADGAAIKQQLLDILQAQAAPQPQQ